MLRKSKLVLIALVAAAPFALAAQANAKPMIDPGFNGPKYKPFPKPYPFPKPHWHPNHRPVIIVERPVYQPIVQQPVIRSVARPVTFAAPAPKTCLTKEYTQEGLVVFKDACTNETASAALPGSPAAVQQLQLQQQQTQQQQGNVQIVSQAPLSTVQKPAVGQVTGQAQPAQINTQASAEKIIEAQPTAKN